MRHLSNFSAVFAPQNKQLFGPILKNKLLMKKKKTMITALNQSREPSVGLYVDKARSGSSILGLIIRKAVCAN